MSGEPALRTQTLISRITMTYPALSVEGLSRIRNLDGNAEATCRLSRHIVKASIPDLQEYIKKHVAY